MKQLSLTCFGSFQAQLGNEPLAGFRTNKVQALLIYLAIELAPQRRESLMILLWPGMPEGSARHNLRQILYHLNQAIPELPPQIGQNGTTAVPLLLANRQTIQLNPVADLSVDVRHFEALLRQVQNHNHLDLLTCHTCRQLLAQAVNLYQGDFLADFYLDDSNEFEEWAEIKRQACRRKALDALETLTTLAIRQKAYPEAQAFAQRQLEVDNLRESAYRQLMEIHALNGRREQALALYESCHRLLAEEWGMAPTSRTTDIYQKILAGDLRFDVPVQQGVRGYELKGEIGEGAYGTIYRAIQPTIGRDVAVKVIRRRYANDPEFIRRFETEAQTIARLEHPHIVPLYDYWRDPEGAYLVMRLLRGGSLLEALQAGPWSPEAVVATLEQIASALTAAHRQGIVHRDIKPANILFDEDGNAYLSDFGIAKDLGSDLQLTGGGGMMGTPDYVSPEQLIGELVTPQADQYSLGAVLYEVLTGERAFAQAPIALRIQKHLTEPLPLISESRPDAPHQIDEVIQRATAKQPSDRFPDILALAEAYRRAVRHDKSRVTVPAAVPAHIERTNPYKGLRAFQQSDAGDFYGRESLISQLVSRLAPSPDVGGEGRGGGRFLAVVGPSGSGKSSVVKAGLIPALRQGVVAGSENWFVAEMVPGTHPLEELELALLPVAVDPPPNLLDPLQKDERGLLRTLHRILPQEDAHLLLVIDQFEELFTLTDNEPRRHFFLNSLVTALTAPRSPLHVVVTLRADFYDRPLQMQPIAQLFKEHTELILPMTGEELAWVIQEPARRVGVTLEEGLVAAIVNEVADQPGTLPLLQYALTELFEERQGQVMTLNAYHALDRVTGALALRAEEVFEILATAERVIARQLFLRLVTLGEGVEDTRRRVLRSELIQLETPEVSSAGPMVEKVIDGFGRLRLLTFDHDPVTRGPTVEVAHEALLREWQRLRGWLDESRADIRLQRLLAAAAHEWLAAEKDEGYLLRGARLGQFEGWATQTTIALTHDEQAFLATSSTARRQRHEAEAARQQRELATAQQLAATERQRAEEQTRASGRLRRFAIGLVIVFLLAVGAAIFAAVQRSEALMAAEAEATAAAEAYNQQAIAEKERAAAEAQKNLARSRELSAFAISNLDSDPELSIMLALEALGITHTLQAKSALHQAIAASPVELTLVASTDLLQTVTFSPDGTQLATGGDDNLVKIWDASTGQLLHSLQLYEINLQDASLAYSPDGLRLAVGDDDGGVSLFDSITGKRLQLIFPGGGVNAIAWNSNGTQFVTANWDGLAKLWDAHSGEEQFTFTIDTDQPMMDVAFNPDGTAIATANLDGTARLWNVQTGEALLTVTHDEFGARGIAFHPDGMRLATEGFDGTIKVWDVASPETADYGHMLFTLSSGADAFSVFNSVSPNSLAFSADGRYLFAFDKGNRVVIWDALTGQEIRRVACRPKTENALAVHPSGERVAVAGGNGIVKICNLTPGQEIITLKLSAAVTNIFFSDDGTRLYTTANDGTVKIWNATLSAGKLSQPAIVTLDDKGKEFWDVQLSPDGSRLVTVGYDEAITFWQADTGQEMFRLTPPGNVPVGPQIAFNPANTQLASTTSHVGEIRIWDGLTGTSIKPLNIGGSLSTDVAFSPDGIYLAAANLDGLVKVWDANKDFALIAALNHPFAVQVVAFSPDGRYLATGVNEGIIHLWDFDLLINKNSAREVYRLTGHTDTIKDITFSPDGRYLASTSFNNTTKVWDVATGQELFTVAGHFDVGAKVAFSPDSRYLAISGWDGTVRIYVLAIDELTTLGYSRLTRWWSVEECQQYLHRDTCPEEIRNP